MSSAADTLLSLIEYVDDVGQLEVLIEAKNLRRIMHAAGHDDVAMRRMIAVGETPGTMLLGVFKSGRTAAEMMALIPAEDRIVQPAKKSAPRTPGAPTGSRDRNSGAAASPDRVTVAGMVLVASGAVISALGVKVVALAIMFLYYGEIVLGVTAVLGAIGGAILLARRRALGAIIGALAAPLATYVSYRYILWMTSEMGRETMFIVEPVLVDILVVSLIFGIPLRLWSKAEAQKEKQPLPETGLSGR